MKSPVQQRGRKYYLLHFLKVKARSLNILRFGSGAVSLVRRPVAGLLPGLRLLLGLPAVLPGREGAVLHGPQETTRKEGSRRSLSLPATSATVQAVLPGGAGLGRHVEQFGWRRLRLPGLVDVQGRGGAELDGRVAADPLCPPGQHEARDLLIPGAAAARPEDTLTGPARLVPTGTVDLAPLPLLCVCTAAAAAACLNTAHTVHRLLPAAADDVLQLLLAAVVVVVVQTAHQCWQRGLASTRAQSVHGGQLTTATPVCPVGARPQVERDPAVQV